MFLSTNLVEQNNVVLDNNNQNILTQKIANILSSGEDNVSFKKVINNLSKKLLEEVGTDRSTDRPLNKALEELKELEKIKEELNNSNLKKEELKPGIFKFSVQADEIIKKIPSSAKVVSLCIEGKLYSSEDMAKLLSDTALAGTSHIVFIIGGSYGLSERVKSRSAVRLSMSKMTFPHRLARIMLLEQIYRGYKINSGEAYHK